MFRVTVKITLRESILDPQGNATQHALQTLGFDSIDRVRIGKLVEMNIRADDEESALRMATEASKKLLANPVMDDYEIVSVSYDD
ncbi:MAG: phosphoribosylformylglycinamidine synthase subunit PurS [Rhodothermia bacterium]